MAARKVGRGDALVRGRDDGRKGHDGVLEEVRGQLARAQERTTSTRERVDALLDRAPAAQLFPRAHLAGEIAEGGADGARPEVDGEDDCGFPIGLVVDGAVMRPPGVARALPHESVLEQRAQHERHGRPRDAGLACDLGA